MIVNFMRRSYTHIMDGSTNRLRLNPLLQL
jgi:hypothetical protein